MRSWITFAGHEEDLDERARRRDGGRVVTVSLNEFGPQFHTGMHPEAGIKLEWLPELGTWELMNCSESFPVRVNQTELYFQQKQRLTQTKCRIGYGEAEMQFERQPDPPRSNGTPGPEFKIPLGRLVIGRQVDQKDAGPQTETRIDLDREILSISSGQITIISDGNSYEIQSRRGKDRLNGREGWESQTLVVGDSIQVGGYDYYTFQFRGDSLVHVGSASILQARNLTRVVEAGKILADVNIDILAGEFVGLLGGSGQGKSTLLNALCGIVPATSGEIRVDGVTLRGVDQLADIGIGYVPQDDIVHRELTVRKALVFAAQLRLALPRRQIEKMLTGVLETLHLTPHESKKIHVLSGGQRKRVSIASELVSNPRFLFLDEPTSGLDPMAEQDLMIELAQVARNKRVGVFCTTHMLQNSHVFSSIVIIHGGRIIFKGKGVDAVRFFQGGPQSSPAETFSTGSSMSGGSAGRSGSVNSIGVSEQHLVSLLPMVYRQIGENARERTERIEELRHSGQWTAGGSAAEAVATEFEETYKASEYYKELPPAKKKPDDGQAGPRSMRRPGSFKVLRVLFGRQWHLLLSDPLNYLFLLAQAIIIGFLVGWVTENLVLQMFLAVIATLWFGCSNGAQQIVGELPIFRRERLAGVGLNVYLTSKYVFQTGLTCIQAALLYLVLLGTHHLFHKEVPPTTDRFDKAQDAQLFADKFFDNPAAILKAELAKSAGPASAPAETPAGPRELKKGNRISGSASEPSLQFASENEAFAARDAWSRWNDLLRKGRGDDVEIKKLPGDTRKQLEREDLLFEVIPPGEGSTAWKVSVMPYVKRDLTAFEIEGSTPLPAAADGSAVSKEVQWHNPTGLRPGSTEYKIFANLAWFFRIRENVVGELGAKKLPPTGASTLQERRSWISFVAFLLGLRFSALFAASVCGVALGLLVSASVRTSVQAVMWVPLIMIPQILFGSYVVTAPEMEYAVRAFSSWLPSYNLQNLMDVANVYGRRVPRMTNKTKLPNFLAMDPYDQEKVTWTSGDTRLEELYEKISPVSTSWQNLNVRRHEVGLRLKDPGDSKTGEAQPDFVSWRRDIYLSQNAAFRTLSPAFISWQVLGGWTIVCYLVTLVNLSRRSIGQ